MKDIELLPYQYKVLAEKQNQKEVFLVGGIGIGKSFTLAHFIITTIANYNKINILLAANTYTQLMNATVKTLIDQLDLYEIPYHATLGGNKKQIKILNSTVYLYSLERPDNIRGIEVGALVLDEIAYSTEYAFQVCLGRLRQPGMPLLVRGATSPNGFNWFYNKYHRFNRKLIKAKTSDNTFLSREYYKYLIEMYGGRNNPLAKQELEGKFINLTEGSVYFGFDRDKHVKKTKGLNKNYPVYVGQDFNIDEMSNVYVQKIPRGTRYVYRVSVETKLTDINSNSFDAAAKVAKDLKDYNKVVIPDSTGKARKTSSSKSDIQIFKDAGLTVKDTRNPRIRDRQNALNRCFLKGLLEIDESCSNLIKELETLSKRQDEGTHSHLAVALGYVINFLEPVRRVPSSRSINI